MCEGVEIHMQETGLLRHFIAEALWMKNYVLHNKGTVFMSVGVCGGGDGFIAGVNIFY